MSFYEHLMNVDVYYPRGIIVIQCGEFEKIRYIGYNVKQAIRKYRVENGLRYKHLYTTINKYKG